MISNGDGNFYVDGHYVGDIVRSSMSMDNQPPRCKHGNLVFPPIHQTSLPWQQCSMCVNEWQALANAVPINAIPAGWACPKCGVVLAPWVTEHTCASLMRYGLDTNTHYPPRTLCGKCHGEFSVIHTCAI